MTTELLILNVAYGLYLAATIPRKIVPLRIVLVVASVAFVVYGIVDDSLSIIVWNALFGGMHSWQLFLIHRERRKLSLDDTERLVHDRVFPGLDVYDFYFIWNLGETTEASVGEVIAAKGERHGTLWLVLDGTVDAIADGRTLASRGPLAVLGEQSLLTGEPASADLVVSDAAVLRRWPHEKLNALERLRPDAHTGLIGSLGRQMSNKLNEQAG